MKRICFVNNKFVLPFSFILLLFLSESSLSQALYWQIIYSGTSSVSTVRTTSDGSIFILSYNDFLKSPDGGQTWLPVSLSPYTVQVRSIAIDDSIIYAGSSGYGIYVSYNKGISWFPGNLQAFNIVSIEVHPSGTVFAGTHNGYIFISSDKGITWESVSVGIKPVTSFAFSSDGKCFAGMYGTGIFRSTNNGSSWQQVYQSASIYSEFQLSAFDDNIVLCTGMDQSFLRSTDGGETWASIMFNNHIFRVIKIDENGICWGYTDAVYTSSDYGDNWNYKGASGQFPTDIHMHNDLVFLASELLYKYDPEAEPPYTGYQYVPLHIGNKWHYFRYGKSQQGSQVQEAYYTDTLIVIDSTYIQNKLYYFYNKRIDPFRYEDNRYVTNYYGTDYLIMDFSLPANAICIGRQVHEEWKFVFGKHRHIKGLIGPTEYMFEEEDFYLDSIGYYYNYYLGYIPMIGIDVTGNSVLIEAIIHDGTSVKTYTYDHNPEFTITPVTATADSILDFTFQVNHHYTRIYFNNQKMFNFIKNVLVESFYNNGTDTLWIAPYEAAHIPLSLNYKLTYPLDMNLMRNGYKYHYRIKATDKGLVPHISYAPEAGYYALTYDPTLDLDNKDSNIPAEYALFQNYPNPFNPFTTIAFSLRETGIVKITIYDILGSEVKVLINEEKQTGFYEINFNASELTSGVYFYRIQSREFIDTKKMVLIR